MYKRINNIVCVCVACIQLPAGAAAASSQQYLLPTAATHNLHAPACYNPAAAVAAAGFLAAGVTDMTSTATAPVLASHSNDNSVSHAIFFQFCLLC